jgi:hypothetical protein
MHTILDAVGIVALLFQSIALWNVTRKHEVERRSLREQVIHNEAPILDGALCDLCGGHVQRFRIIDRKVVCANHTEFYS